MEEITEHQTLFTQQDVKHTMIFILATLERNWEKDSANTGTMPKTDQITMNSAHIHKHQHELDKGIEVLILKGNLHQKHERELCEDKFICLMGTKTPTGLNIELKHNGRELYKAFSYLFFFLYFIFIII